MPQKIALGVPLLIYNLIRIALYLGSGPAYPQGLVDEAILSLLIDVAA